MANLIILATSFVIYLVNISKYPLRNWDEAWYGEIIKNMASGNYSLLIPYFNGHYYFDKPPLYFWLSLPFFRIFGAGEWQTRLISVLTAVGATFLVFLIAKKLFGKSAGFFSFLVFVTLGQVVVRFAHGNIDALLVFFTLLAFYFYLLSQKSKLFSILCGVAIGLGFLAKGYSIGLYNPLVITIYSLITNKKLPNNYFLIAAFAAVTSSWYYIAASFIFKKDFINWYILNPSGNLLSSPFQSFSLSYFTDLIRDTGFWPAIILLFFIKVRKIPKKDLKIIIAFLISIFALILPLNLLSEKLGWYNLPSYPFVAIIIGYFAQLLFKKSKIITAILVIVLTIAGITNVKRVENIHPDRSQVGADLGKFAGQIVPINDTIILDDHDFTSFLYYSDHKEVFTIEEKEPKFQEWWILNFKNIPRFLEENKTVWIITPNPNNLPKDLNGQLIKSYQGYNFIKFEK